MVLPRTGHTATLLPNGKVLVVGGEHLLTSAAPFGLTDTAELYDPVTGNFTLTGSLNTARTGHTATLLPSGKVLIVGGGIRPAELSRPIYRHICSCRRHLVRAHWALHSPVA